MTGLIYYRIQGERLSLYVLQRQNDAKILRSSGPQILDALTTRIDKMAAYFGRACGVDADDLRQEAWVAVFEMAPNLDRSIGSPGSTCSSAHVGGFWTRFALNGNDSMFRLGGPGSRYFLHRELGDAVSIGSSMLG